MGGQQGSRTAQQEQGKPGRSWRKRVMPGGAEATHPSPPPPASTAQAVVEQWLSPSSLPLCLVRSNCAPWPRHPVVAAWETMAGESKAASATAPGTRCARRGLQELYKGLMARKITVPPMAKSLLSFFPENTFKSLPPKAG